MKQKEECLFHRYPFVVMFYMATNERAKTKAKVPHTKKGANTEEGLQATSRTYRTLFNGEQLLGSMYDPSDTHVAVKLYPTGDSRQLG